MKKREEIKKFSIKKLSTCILYSIVITTFIAFTILFIVQIPKWIFSNALSASEPNSELLIENGKYIDEFLKRNEKAAKATYGEEYPATGILMEQLWHYSESGAPIVQTYMFTAVLGTVLGAIVYIVSEQGARGKQLVIELILAFLIIFFSIMAINLGYKVVLNEAISLYNTADAEYQTFVYDTQNVGLIILFYIGVCLIIYFGNLIKQKILTNKLNKELNK